MRKIDLKKEPTRPDIPVPPDQDLPSPVKEPPDPPQQDPPAPVKEPGPEPPTRLADALLLLRHENIPR